MEQSIYLLLDSKGSPIARGRIQGRTDGPYWQIQVEDGKIDEILEHKKLKLLSIMDSGPSYEGTIVRSRNDMIQLEVSKLDRDGGDMRKEAVIPVTSEPLVVTCQVLRMRPTERAAVPLMYAAKFVDLCNDEETLLRESVFNLQLRGRPKTS